MLDKMLGVSPPQKGLAQDSREVDRKLLLHSDLKKEFDQKLKEKLTEHKQSKTDSPKESKPDQKPKIERSDKDELRADERQKKPSGGTKKKVADSKELDETTISNIMASSESEVEIPDQRKDLATVETEIPLKENIQSTGGFDPAKVIEQKAGSEAKLGVVPKGISAPTEALVPAEKVIDAQPIEGLAETVAPVKNSNAQTVQITPEMIAAFRAAQEGQATDSPKAEKLDANLAAALGIKIAKPNADGEEQKIDTSSELAKAIRAAEANAGESAGVATVSAMTTPIEAGVAAAGITTAAFAMTSGPGLIQEKESEVELTEADQTNFADLKEMRAQNEIPTDVQMPILQNEKEVEAKPTMTFEQQLGAEVGFESSDDGHQEVSKSALIQKMKAFEVEKGLSPEKASAFELKVLAMLQQERNGLAAAQGHGQKSSSGSSQQDKSDTMNEGAKDLQGIKPSSEMASLHTGQTQNDFKNHLSSPIDHAGAPLSAAQIQEHREENIQEVMKSAKVLAVKGGGEMIVKMSPDGMGPIALKVMMQDGKVNIEMQTQDKSVKKLIEDSLTELKSGLAAQRIHVEHVKIDTVTATNTENSAKFQSNQNSADAQGRQQEFWKQFRENSNNQARRSSYDEVQSVHNKESNAPNALKPLTTTARSGARTGSTINRVA